MSSQKYPVAFRHVVPAKQSILQSLKSRLKHIPDDRQDYAAVLDFDGKYELVDNGVPILKAEGIGSARALILVDVRPVEWEVNVEVPCYGHVERRKVTVRYASQVTAPHVVLQSRFGELKSKLENWTSSVLHRESPRYAVDDHDRFLAAARSALANLLIEQPPVPRAGLSLEVTDVSSELPTRAHESELLETRRQAELDVAEQEASSRIAGIERRLKHQAELEHDQMAASRWRASQSFDDERREKQRWHEQEEARMLEEAFNRGPEALLALMASRNPESIEQLTNYAIRDRSTFERLLMAAAESGVISRSAIEDMFTKAANHMLDGSGAHVGTGAPSGEIDAGSQRGANQAGDKSDEHFDPLDDDFDDRRVETPNDSKSTSENVDDFLSKLLPEDERDESTADREAESRDESEPWTSATAAHVSVAESAPSPAQNDD